MLEFLKGLYRTSFPGSTPLVRKAPPALELLENREVLDAAGLLITGLPMPERVAIKIAIIAIPVEQVSPAVPGRGDVGSLIIDWKSPSQVVDSRVLVGDP